MEKSTLILILSIVFSFFNAPDLFACKCRHTHINEDLEECNEIFIGTVIESSNSPFSGEAVIQIECSWKGDFKNNKIHLTGSGNCSYRFQEGKKYLVFSRNGRTTICRSNKLLEDLKQELHYTAMIDYYKNIPVEKNPRFDKDSTLSDYDLAYLNIKDNVTEINEFVGLPASFIVSDTLASKMDWYRSRTGMNLRSYAIRLNSEEQAEFGCSLLFIRASLRPLEYIRDESIELLRQLKRDI